MSKRFLIFIFLLSIFCCSAGCENNIFYEPEDPEIYTSDISSLDELNNSNIVLDIEADVTKAETEMSSYEFYGRTETENINIVTINEIITVVLKREYGYSVPKGRLIHFIGEDGLFVSDVSLMVNQMVATNGRTVINPDLPNSVGALFYGSSRNLLPS